MEHSLEWIGEPQHKLSQAAMEMAVGGVVVTSNIVNKPCSPLPPSQSPYPRLKKVVPLTALDLVAPSTPIPMIMAFPPPMPSNRTMVDTLLKTLFHYPHLVGSFGSDDEDTDRPSILLDNTGVRVIETEIPTTLQDNLPLDPSNKLYFNLTPLMSGSELLRVQLNRFACGGMILGITIHHWVADATSYASFLTSWSRMARGLDVHPLPYHDRSLAVTPSSQSRLEFDHAVECRKKPFADCSPIKDASGPLLPATNLSVHYSNDFLGRLKAKVNGVVGESSRDQGGTFQCLMAHVWKKMTCVRGLDGDTTTSIQFSVNGRKRVAPPVPTEYFGNYVLATTATMKVRDLLKGSYSEVGQVIRKAITKADDAYFKTFVEYAASLKAKEVMTEMVGPMQSLGPHVFNTSWLRLGFDEIDFGSGGLCSFLVPGIPIEGFTLLLPSYEEGGGVNVLVALKDKEGADLFQKISHSLD